MPQVKPEALARYLEKDLKSLYFLHGREATIVREACDLIVSTARAQGVEERVVFNSDTDSWEELFLQSESQSLFATRKLFHIRLWSEKNISKPLTKLIESDLGENIYLIQADAFGQSATRTKWFKNLQAAAVEVHAWPVRPRELPGWLIGRAKTLGFQLTREGATVIAARTEGNLLAASQELEKIALTHTGDAPVDIELLTKNIADNSSFTAYRMVDLALEGKVKRSLRALWRLMHEGVAIPQIIWAWQNSLKELHQLFQAGKDNPSASPGQLLNKAGVWRSRQPAMTRALSQLEPSSLLLMSRLLAQADSETKGAQKGNPWTTLANLCVVTASVNLPEQLSQFPLPDSAASRPLH